MPVFDPIDEQESEEIRKDWDWFRKEFYKAVPDGEFWLFLWIRFYEQFGARQSFTDKTHLSRSTLDRRWREHRIILFHIYKRMLQRRKGRR